MDGQCANVYICLNFEQYTGANCNIGNNYAEPYTLNVQKLSFMVSSQWLHLLLLGFLTRMVHAYCYTELAELIRMTHHHQIHYLVSSWGLFEVCKPLLCFQMSFCAKALPWPSLTVCFKFGRRRKIWYQEDLLIAS